MSDTKFILKKVPDGPQIALSKNLTVGRSVENDLKLVQGSPSRHHALLSVTDGAVWLEDLNSTNGTYVNDQRITSKIKLGANDKVRFDEEEYQFLVLGEQPADNKTAVRTASAVDVVANSGRVKVPAGWVDERQVAEGKTQYMSAEELEKMRRSAQGTEAAGASYGVTETPVLIVLGGPESVSRFQLRATSSGKKEWTVGSEGEREILIQRVGVSALHAKIVNEGNRWKVIDQVSANGTFVNGNRCITGYLSSGDRISFGSFECVFQLPKGGAAASTSATNTSNLKKVLLICAVSFLITVAVLYFLLNKL